MLCEKQKESRGNLKIKPYGGKEEVKRNSKEKFLGKSS